jgi:hypothetical protein
MGIEKPRRAWRLRLDAHPPLCFDAASADANAHHRQGGLDVQPTARVGAASLALSVVGLLGFAALFLASLF